ncbi:MAG: hypothetical protein ACYDHZ_00400 [Dehalococcoidia bacterium]
MEDGNWGIKEILPPVFEEGPGLIRQVGLIQDILASAIKLLTNVYLIKPTQSGLNEGTESITAVN